MNFNDKDILQFKELLQTTTLQQGYQKLQTLLNQLKIDVAKKYPTFKVQNTVMENKMDYAYFQLQDQALKDHGLKLAIIFDYQRFSMKVWISGANRQVQTHYHQFLLAQKDQSLVLSNDPKRQDFIVSYDLNISGTYEDILLDITRVIDLAYQQAILWPCIQVGKI
ncbi:MAG: hypothetical protein MR210_07505 [Erysipelotrichaceae bacterium]|nr:hypothetical protein [Erysipelotrichaceae bacterium]MDY5251501.1 hypothetical protein [Erysipelotrichaceae bacterium]